MAVPGAQVLTAHQLIGSILEHGLVAPDCSLVTITLTPTFAAALFGNSSQSADNSIASLIAGSTSGTTGSPSSSRRSNPTAPWAPLSTAPQPSDLVKAVLAGHRFVDPTAAKLDVAGGDATANQNYKDLFALYQGIAALNGLATQAQASNVGATQLKQLQQAFASGLKQVQTYLDGNPFGGFQVFQGQIMSSDKTTAGIQHETDTYTTGTVYSGPSSGAVPAFQGPVAFSLEVTKVSGAKVTVNFDLSQMGSTPRTFSNVINYLNGQLQAANIATRFSSVKTVGQPQVIKAGGTTVTGAVGPDQYALKITGSSAEKLSFSAPASDPAVYVAQTSGLTGGTKPDAVQQLVKFDAAGTPLATSSATGQVFKQTLANTAATRALATAADGSVYALSDVTGPVDGQAIKGGQDVALTKYDSTGNVVFTRTLGSASSASGFALAVSADGSQVAVTGSVTGSLDPTNPLTSKSGASAAGTDSFVSVYDAQGQELWTQQTGSTTGGDVQANGVTFGPNGMVYVAGQVNGALPGATSSGGTDGFLQGFHATGVALKDGSGQTEWVVTQSYVSQFGTGGTDRANGLTVSGSTVYVAGLENGHAVVRSFDQSGTGSTSLTPAAVRDLGDVQGGSVAGISVNSDGSVIVAGSTHNGALAGGSITQAYSGGKEVFIASLAADLQAAGTDRLTYLGGGGDQGATAVTTSGGKVYVTGQIATTPPPGTGQTSAHDGFAAAVDPQTGVVSWQQRYAGLDHEAAPAAIAVSQGGASVLDLFGLPTGAIDYGASQQVTANTSIRPGDEFFVKPSGGVAQAVKISADDTYATLAQKIQRASGFTLIATVVPGVKGSGDQISLKPANKSRDVAIVAGPSGGDALRVLGFNEGIVSSNFNKAFLPVQPTAQNGQSTRPKNSLKNGYSLQLPSDLNLSSSADIKRALTSLSSALSSIRSIYRDLTTPPSSSTTGASSGPVPRYLTNQIANYQSALDRLTGGSG